MATSRLVGTNETISTYGDVTRDYQQGELPTWEVDTTLNLVTGNLSHVLEVYADSASYTDSIQLFGATADATRFRIIRAAPGHGHGGIPNTGAVFVSTTDAALFSLAEGFATIYDICGKLTINSATNRPIFECSNTGSVNKRITNCIAFDGTNAGAGLVHGFLVPIDQSYIVNCLAVGNDGEGFTSNAGTTNFFYNCTAVSNTTGFRNSGGTTTKFVNCLGASNTTNFSNSGTATGNNNASSDATSVGTSPRTSQTFTFVNAGARDYHLSASDAGALGFGANLSADATFAFDDDIDGQTITTWSIGFDSRVASTPAGASIYYYSMVR